MLKGASEKTSLRVPSQDGTNETYWSKITDLRICKRFAAIKFSGGKEELHQNEKMQSGPFIDLFHSVLAKHQPDATLEAVDFSMKWKDGRWRGQLYHCNHGWTISLRQMPHGRPDLGKLGFQIKDIVSLGTGTGLILFSGSTGAGKSTTMAGTVFALEEMNLLGNTVTIEDPIEYVYGTPFIMQREVGIDVESFSAGTFEAMRQYPRTIVVGEIRDHKTAEVALEAGLSGHRVMATIHADSIEDTISRMQAFLSARTIQQLPKAMRGVVSQYLVHKEGRVRLLYESLLFDKKAKNVLGGGAEAVQRLVHEQNRQNRPTLKEQANRLIHNGMLTDEDVAAFIDN